MKPFRNLNGLDHKEMLNSWPRDTKCQEQYCEGGKKSTTPKNIIATVYTQLSVAFLNFLCPSSRKGTPQTATFKTTKLHKCHFYLYVQILTGPKTARLKSDLVENHVQTWSRVYFHLKSQLKNLMSNSHKFRSILYTFNSMFSILKSLDWIFSHSDDLEE